MATWSDFAAAAPDLAERVGERFTTHRHHTMATLRRDGSPRISGTEVELTDGELFVGMMPGARRAADLRRDPRLAVHSHCVDPPAEDPAGWPGEAKVAGTATEVSDRSDPAAAHRFRVAITEVVLTRIGEPPDHLVVEWWRPGRGVTRIERR